MSGKSGYDQAFVLLAAASAVAAGATAADELLREALAAWEEHFWDEAVGLAVESWDRQWTRSELYRGANSNMHTVESLLAVADVTGEETWRKRALRITESVVHHFARDRSWLLPEHYDANWQPLLGYHQDDPQNQVRPFGVSVGHLFEWSRLCLHLRAALAESAPAWLLSDAIALFNRGVECGWRTGHDPGFFSTVDWAGRVVSRAKIHWVAAEAIGAAAAMHIATTESTYREWCELWWQHARELFIDWEHGSWYHELESSEQPRGVASVGKPDIYHALQATLVSRLPLSPAFAPALRAADLLDASGDGTRHHSA
jgi:mannose/cellobiose epimerase-like protein (N-acyl-D-glucosamine 2-epimerase family)